MMKCSRIGDIGLQEYNQFRLSCRHPDSYRDSIRLESIEPEYIPDALSVTSQEEIAWERTGERVTLESCVLCLVSEPAVISAKIRGKSAITTFLWRPEYTQFMTP